MVFALAAIASDLLMSRNSAGLADRMDLVTLIPVHLPAASSALLFASRRAARRVGKIIVHANKKRQRQLARGGVGLRQIESGVRHHMERARPQFHAEPF